MGDRAGRARTLVPNWFARKHVTSTTFCTYGPGKDLKKIDKTKFLDFKLPFLTIETVFVCVGVLLRLGLSACDR